MATGKQKEDSKRRATQHRVADAHYIITKFIPLPLLIPVTAKKMLIVASSTLTPRALV